MTSKPPKSIDLLSLIITLTPLESPDRETAPRWWGRAAHALLLDVVRGYEPDLATALHADKPAEDEDTFFPDLRGGTGTPVRPFSVSTLIGRFRDGLPDREESYTLRFTSLFRGLSETLLQAAHSGPLSPGKVVELDHLPFRIEKVKPDDSGEDHSPWAGQQSYESLSAPWLLAADRPPRRLKLLFTSPTTFKSGRMHVPLPLPELVFGNLLERWNAYAPLAFPGEARRYARECLAVSRYRLSSRSVPFKAGGRRTGAVGEVTYTSVNYDRYWMSLMTVLAHFALFSGVGGGTSQGLGQCRLVEMR